MSDPARPWLGKIPRGFKAWVAAQCGIAQKRVAEVLSGREKSARIEAYVCGALGIAMPAYPKKYKAPPLPTTRRVIRPQSLSLPPGAVIHDAPSALAAADAVGSAAH